MLKNTIFFVFIVLSITINAQNLDATDKSEKTILRYKSVIRNNKKIVDFIEYSLEEKGLPRHLKNLALIESSFNSETVSSAGAKGIWQFMTSHANQYGLSDRDRSDIYRSTKAVTNSLINLYNKYGNWVTVVAAFNCGEGNIQKAMNRAGSTNYLNFYKYLPNETINHVQKYLDASYASGELGEVLNDFYSSNLNYTSGDNSYKEFIPKEIDYNISSTPINSAYNLNVIIEYLDFDEDYFFVLNKNLENELDEKGEGLLFLPNDFMTTFSINQDEILVKSLSVVN